jgi:hypothetical protein
MTWAAVLDRRGIVYFVATMKSPWVKGERGGWPCPGKRRCEDGLRG